MATFELSPATLRKGTAIAAFSAVSFGSAVIFVRYAYQSGVLPGTVAFLRFSIAALVLVVFLRAHGQRGQLSGWQSARLFLLGFVAYTILAVTWVTAFSLIPAWLVSLIVATYPLMVNLASWFFLRERFYRQQVVALSCVLVGSGILFWRPFEGAAWTGVTLMVVNVLVSTAFILVGQRWMRGLSPVICSAWLITGGMVGTFFYSLFSHELSFAFAPAGWLWVTLFAVISTVLAATSMWWGIGLIGPARVAIIGSFEPVVSILLAVSLLGERLLPLQIAGGALILLGIFLVQWTPERQ
ncbi:MAG: DMT family transporter [Anaerolineales bacterium]|nr:DMT family transporter [Anaerolineales bacterium]